MINTLLLRIILILLTVYPLCLRAHKIEQSSDTPGQYIHIEGYNGKNVTFDFQNPMPVEHYFSYMAKPSNRAFFHDTLCITASVFIFQYILSTQAKDDNPFLDILEVADNEAWFLVNTNNHKLKKLDSQPHKAWQYTGLQEVSQETRYSYRLEGLKSIFQHRERLVPQTISDDINTTFPTLDKNPPHVHIQNTNLDSDNPIHKETSEIRSSLDKQENDNQYLYEIHISHQLNFIELFNSSYYIDQHLYPDNEHPMQIETNTSSDGLKEIFVTKEVKFTTIPESNMQDEKEAEIVLFAIPPEFKGERLIKAIEETNQLKNCYLVAVRKPLNNTNRLF